VPRRSIAQDEPGVDFVKFFISVATATTSAKCANRRRCVLAIPIEIVSGGNRCCSPRRFSTSIHPRSRSASS
jgi:hypothetical protein